MSYSDDLKKVLALLGEKKYTYNVDEDEAYLQQKNALQQKSKASQDTAKANAAANTAGFENSYGKAAEKFLDISAQKQDLQTRQTLQNKASDQYQKEVTALQNQAQSLQKKVEDENERIAKAAAAKKNSSSGKNGNTAPKEAPWNSKNPIFMDLEKKGKDVYSQMYMETYDYKTSSASAQEKAYRVLGEFVYSQVGKDLTKAMALAKYLKMPTKYIQRASDMEYWNEVRG